MILFPVWPFRWLIPIGTGFMSLQLAVTFVREVRNVLHPSEKAVPGELGSDVGEVVPELEGRSDGELSAGPDRIRRPARADRPADADRLRAPADRHAGGRAHQR